MSAAEWHAKYGAIDRGERTHDKDANYREEVAVVERFVPHGRVLDAGCNAGWLLGYLQRSPCGYELEGAELSASLAEIARRRLGIPVHTAVVQDLETEPFDAIVSTDVIEHVPPEELGRFLQSIHRLLRDGGHLFLKTPNSRFTALKSRLTAALPAFVRRRVLLSADVWDAREHLVHFDARTLPAILDRHGFRTVHVFVPLPVQTRQSPRGALVLRWAIHRTARLMGGRHRVPAFAQDLFVVARRT